METIRKIHYYCQLSQDWGRCDECPYCDECIINDSILNQKDYEKWEKYFSFIAELEKDEEDFENWKEMAEEYIFWEDDVYEQFKEWQENPRDFYFNHMSEDEWLRNQ